MPHFGEMRNLPYLSSYTIEAPDLTVQHYDAYKSVEGRYSFFTDSIDIVALINACMNDIPAAARGAKIFLKGATFAGSGLIQKPTGKTVHLIGEYLALPVGSLMTQIQCKGIEAIETGYNYHLVLENLDLVCNEAVGAFVDCRYVEPIIRNVKIFGSDLPTIGIHLQPKGNPFAPVFDRVMVTYVKGSAAYIGQEWFTVPTIFSAYKTNKTLANQPILQLGSTSPLTAYGAGSLYGVDIAIAHLYSPAQNPDYALTNLSSTHIGLLDFEGVTAGTALINNLGGPLNIGLCPRGGGPKFLANAVGAQLVSVNSFFADSALLASKIDLTNPAAWTVGVPGDEVCGYCYIPSGTNLAAGITTYDLYNKWTCNGYTKIEMRPQGALPTGIHVQGVYDRDATVANQLRIVIDNTTGGGVVLGADADFWIKLC